MEIDYDYLQTGTAIGFRVSRELCSNYLLLLHLLKMSSSSTNASGWTLSDSPTARSITRDPGRLSHC